MSGFLGRGACAISVLPATVPQGGTGLTTITDHAVMIGSGVGAVTPVGPGTDGQLLIGSTGADPVFAALTSSSGFITFTPGAGSLDLNLFGSVAVSFDGDAGTATPALGVLQVKGAVGGNITTSGAASTVSIAVSGTTQYAIQVGDATGSLDSLSIGSANQVLQSSGAGSDPAWSTATYPATTSQGDVIYSSSDNTVAGLTKDATATRYIANTGASNNPAWDQINLANGVTGTLPVANGGTGASTITAHALIVGDGTNAVNEVAVGATNEVLLGATGADPTWGAVPNAALVNSSITLSDGNNITVTGSPVSLGGTATIAVTGTTQYAVQVGDATGSLDSLGVGTNNTVLHGNTGANPSWSAIDLAADVTGTLPVANGGSGAATFTDHGVLLGSAAGAFSVTAVGASNTVLHGNTGADPTYSAVDLAADVTGVTPVANGGTGLSTITDHAVMIGSGAGAVTPLAVGATGETIMGSTGADPTWTGSPSFSGTATAGTGLVATTGDITASAGNLNLPTTNAALTEGVIEINSTRFIHSYGTDNLFIGAGAGNGTLSGVQNVGIGTNTLDSLTTGTNNFGLGFDALTACTSGLGNIAIGADVLEKVTDGDYNIGIGFVCCPFLTTGVRNTCIGVGALGGPGITSASYNCCIGNASGADLTTTDSDNIAIMNRGVATDNNTIRIGTQGTGDGQQNSCFIAGINGSTPAGAVTGTVLVDASGQLGTVGDIIGTNNLNLPTTNAALSEGVIEINSVRQFHAYGTGNLFVGANSGNGTLSGATYNVGVGRNSLDALTTGDYNVGIGNSSLSGVQDGLNNCGIGSASLFACTSGSYNMAMGASALIDLTTGVRNAAIGQSALENITTGGYNIAIGDSAGSSLTLTDSDNIIFSNTGTAGDNNTIRIGTQGTGDGQQDTCFIAGIVGTNVGSVATIVAHDANGQLGTSTITAGAGITVTPGASAITIASTDVGLSRVDVTTATQAMAVDTEYTTNYGAGVCAYTLPATAAVGEVIEVWGNSANGWSVAQNAGQTIHIMGVDTTTGVGGSLASTTRYDCLRLKCTVANTDFVAIPTGNLTVV